MWHSPTNTTACRPRRSSTKHATRRARTIALLDDLDDEQLEVPHISNVNPPRWELGHIAFFFEVFFLRELGRDPQLLRGADEAVRFLSRRS